MRASTAAPDGGVGGSGGALRGADRIVVGSPLPLSMYGADRRLLLVKGTLVDSERTRESLLRDGRYASDGSALELGAEETRSAEESAPFVKPPLDVYAREVTRAMGQTRTAARMSRETSGDSYLCWLWGADEVYGLMVTAPGKPDGSLVPVSEGQTWIFHMMYMTSVIKFGGTIRKVLLAPEPMVNVSLPQKVEIKQVRVSPRVACCISGTLNLEQAHPVKIMDIGTGGVRITLERKHCEPKMGMNGTLCFSIRLIDEEHHFNTPVTVVGIRRDLEKDYPELCFAGVRLDSLSDRERLILHGYVYEQTALGFNALWRVLNPR